MDQLGVSSAGIFDIEPYRNPNPSEPADPQDYFEHLRKQFDPSYNKDGEQPISSDSGDDAISKLANELNIKLDDSTKDYLMQYYLNEKASQNSWSRTMDASNSQYQRAVADLQKAGINPFLALQSLSGSSPTSSSSGVQGGIYTSKKNAETRQSTSVIGSILSILGIIAGAIIGAML